MEMRRVAQSIGSDVLFGMGSFKDEGEKAEYFNSAVLSRYDGEPDQIYHKQHLVPFGEYIPFRKILKFINKFSKFYIGDTTPGDGPQLMQLSDGTIFGTAICYEVLFPNLMRKFASNGAEFFVHITNDTWYGDSSMPWQHLTLAVFRAVENRKWVLRSANSGYSGIISPTGKIIRRTELFHQCMVIEKFKPNNIQTIYSRYGDWFSILSTVIVLGFIFLIIFKRRIERKILSS
jgi:apolipoprotein N-acyltransferase